MLRSLTLLKCCLYIACLTLVTIIFEAMRNTAARTKRLLLMFLTVSFVINKDIIALSSMFLMRHLALEFTVFRKIHTGFRRNDYRRQLLKLKISKSV